MSVDDIVYRSTVNAQEAFGLTTEAMKEEARQREQESDRLTEEAIRNKVNVKMAKELAMPVAMYTAESPMHVAALKKEIVKQEKKVTKELRQRKALNEEAIKNEKAISDEELEKQYQEAELRSMKEEAKQGKEIAAWVQSKTKKMEKKDSKSEVKAEKKESEKLTLKQEVEEKIMKDAAKIEHKQGVLSVVQMYPDLEQITDPYMHIHF